MSEFNLKARVAALATGCLLVAAGYMIALGQIANDSSGPIAVLEQEEIVRASKAEGLEPPSDGDARAESQRTSGFDSGAPPARAADLLSEPTHPEAVDILNRRPPRVPVPTELKESIFRFKGRDYMIGLIGKSLAQSPATIAAAHLLTESIALRLDAAGAPYYLPGEELPDDGGFSVSSGGRRYVVQRRDYPLLDNALSRLDAEREGLVEPWSISEIEEVLRFAERSIQLAKNNL